MASNNKVTLVMAVLAVLVAVCSAQALPVAPTFTTQPASVTVNDHVAVDFTVAVTPATTTIQWQENSDVNSNVWVDLPGETGLVLRVSSRMVGRLATQGYSYRAVANNGGSVTISNVATITINVAPEIRSQNTSVTGVPNGFVTIYSTATGSPTPAAQWSVSKDRGVTFTPIAGANSPSYTFRVTPADNFNFYRVTYSNAAGTDTSDNILLTVPLYSAPAIITNPVSQTATAGVGSDVTFTVDYSGGDLPTVQWQVKTVATGRFINIDGATALSYTRRVTEGDRNAVFRAVITNAQGVLISGEATLTIPTLVAPVIVLQPTFAGRTTLNTLVTLNARATGSPAPVAQWQRTNGAGTVFFPVGTAGATGDSYSFVLTANDTLSSFRVVYTNAAGSATSNAYTVTVANTPTTSLVPIIEIQPVPVTVQEGETAVFYVLVSGFPVPNLIWQVSTDLGYTYTNITNQVSDTLRVVGVNAMNHKLYYRVLANNTAGFVFSQAAYLTVVRPDAPLVVRQPASQEVPVGKPVVFDTQVSGFPAPTYQWESSQDGGVTWTPIVGATSPSLQFSAVAAAQQNTLYRVRVTNSTGSIASTPALLTVFSPNAPVVKVHPKSKSVLQDSVVSLFASATGNPTPTVQWVSRASADQPFTPINGATSTTYTFNASGFQQYKAIFTNTDGTATSSIATINVYGRLYRVSKSSASTVSVAISLVIAVIALAF